MIKTLNICGIEHSVQYKTDTFNSDVLHFGQINFSECKIFVNDSLPESLKTQTLWHEALHGMLVHLGYTELSENETFVQGLASALNQVGTLKDATEG